MEQTKEKEVITITSETALSKNLGIWNFTKTLTSDNPYIVEYDDGDDPQEILSSRSKLEFISQNFKDGKPFNDSIERIYIKISQNYHLLIFSKEKKFFITD